MLTLYVGMALVHILTCMLTLYGVAYRGISNLCRAGCLLSLYPKERKKKKKTKTQNEREKRERGLFHLEPFDLPLHAKGCSRNDLRRIWSEFGS